METTVLDILQWQVETCMTPFLAERTELGPDDDLLGEFAKWLVAKQNADELWQYFSQPDCDLEGEPTTFA